MNIATWRIQKFLCALTLIPCMAAGQNARRVLVVEDEEIHAYNPLTRTFKQLIEVEGAPVDRAVRDSTLFILTADEIRTVNVETGTTLNSRRTLSNARRLALDPDGGVWVTHTGSKVRDFRGVFV
ncbi:MAG: hypothetical protein RMM53_00120, partial [Bacteroidia bacterium]|nr:hypothetical protein [Bacteroidia bacterium]MDW8332599.1 hypothetical protein [Bacteroidia bacterium]